MAKEIVTHACAALASLPIQQTHAADIDVGDAYRRLAHAARGGPGRHPGNGPGGRWVASTASTSTKPRSLAVTGPSCDLSSASAAGTAAVYSTVCLCL